MNEGATRHDKPRRWLRRPSTTELVIQALIALFLVIFISEYFSASSATSCFVPNRSPNCYPWGMTEGPMEGGSWNYANKENYLLDLKWRIPVVAAAVLAPFFAGGRWRGLIAMLAIFLGGQWILAWILESLFPL